MVTGETPRSTRTETSVTLRGPRMDTSEGRCEVWVW